MRITLIRSKIGRKSRHRRILTALGLRKLHQTVEKPDNTQIRGMIRKVSYLLKVEEDVRDN